MSQDFIVVGIGEVLWDVFPDGPRFGGAPTNFACHAAQLGARSYLVSQIGVDDLGERACVALRERGVEDAFVCQSDSLPTGTVQVSLDAAGVPHFRIATPAAWDQLAWSDRVAELAERTDAVCFGTLGQRTDNARQSIQRFVAATPAQALRILDINLRPPFVDVEILRQSLQLANILKLNDAELLAVAELLQLSGSERSLLEQIQKRYHYRLIAWTRGAQGAVLLQGERWSEQPAAPTTVVDTVGAGDAFTAALTLGLLQGRDLEEINRHACRVAAYVCSQAGATPGLPATLTEKH